MKALIASFFLCIAAQGLVYGNNREQHIVIVTLLYNTGEECIETLQSAFAQHYKNFHMIIIDDCSTNNAADMVKNYIVQRGMQDKVIFIQNAVRQDVTLNHALANSMCNDHDIVVTLDGDGDMFAHQGVLAYVNKLYTEHPQTWMTYGSFVAKSTGKRVFEKPLPVEVLRTRTVRRHDFVTSHLRTHRAWLFKQVKHADLLYRDGKGPKYCAELPFLLPMLEMAGEKHVRYVEDILYVYKEHSHIHNNADMALYLTTLDYYQSKPPYPTLTAAKVSK